MTQEPELFKMFCDGDLEYSEPDSQKKVHNIEISSLQVEGDGNIISSKHSNSTSDNVKITQVPM